MRTVNRRQFLQSGSAAALIALAGRRRFEGRRNQ